MLKSMQACLLPSISFRGHILTNLKLQDAQKGMEGVYMVLMYLCDNKDVVCDSHSAEIYFANWQ